MADAIDVGQTQHDQLEAEHALIRLDHQFFGDFGVAVSLARSAAEIFVDRRRLALAPVVNAEGADLDEALHAGQAHRLGDIDRAHDIDL